jgi:hypothetical protein
MKDIIKVDLKKFEWDGIESIYLAQNRDNWQVIVNAIMDLPV